MFSLQTIASLELPELAPYRTLRRAAEVRRDRKMMPSVASWTVAVFLMIVTVMEAEEFVV